MFTCCFPSGNGKIRAEDAEIAEEIVRAGSFVRTRQVWIFRFAQSHQGTKKLARGRKAAFPSIAALWRSVNGKAASRPARHLRAFVALRRTTPTGTRGMAPTP